MKKQVYDALSNKSEFYFSRRSLSTAMLLSLIAVLSACGLSPRNTSSGHVSAVKYQAGATPFFGVFDVQGSGLENLSEYSFRILPKPGSVSAPVHVNYSFMELQSRGYIKTDPVSGLPSKISFPVFGLYAGFDNSVSLDFTFTDGSTQEMPVTVTTSAYTDPSGIYQNPVILKPRDPMASLGFSYFVVKSQLMTPVILDTDGEIRWVGTGFTNATSTAISGDGFVIGDSGSSAVYYLGLGGTILQNPLQLPVSLQSAGISSFHHNMDPGKQGFLAELNSPDNVESIGAEISTNGFVLNTWDMGAIISSYMLANGDDPTLFVRPGVDWFHMNAMTYDSRDDTVIVSSRENFVIKLDYKTGSIIWIFGDPTKYWFTFPSLRAKALTLQGGGLYPIGQHGTSITSDGLLMLFNDGLGSANEPSGAPAGESRTFSAVSAYSIDDKSLTAKEVWDFDYGQTIYSKVCSSVYEAPGKTYLVDYAVADNITHARLVGLDSQHNVVFDFQYPTSGCATSWNAVPIALDNFKFDQ